ncbi:hypothetical protein ACFFLM_24525 [Deinococcus oregonensis]|uniref:Uncharacterized protein n=1 Tax=Deinococcus oregonensis TaxID=1805970 RepID=A0ABV6B830_9DEIO
MPKLSLLPYADMSDMERDVIDALRIRGALTIRSIEQDIGPRKKWERLLDTKVLHKSITLYGEVTAFSERGREMIQASTGKRLPYLLAPGTIVDRAYQVDAVRLLTDQGYGVERTVYKTRNGKLPPRADGSETTDQIAYVVMRLPEAQLRRLNALWPGLAHPVNEPVKPDSWGMYPEVLGRPHLYASISGGGTSRSMVDRWFQNRSNARLISEWHTPLLLAVPSDEHLRTILRRNKAKHAKSQAALQWESRSDPTAALRMDYQPLELIMLPLPTT